MEYTLFFLDNRWSILFYFILLINGIRVKIKTEKNINIYLENVMEETEGIYA